jgi:hypothetical protein
VLIVSARPNQKPNGAANCTGGHRHTSIAVHPAETSPCIHAAQHPAETCLKGVGPYMNDSPAAAFLVHTLQRYKVTSPHFTILTAAPRQRQLDGERLRPTAELAAALHKVPPNRWN